MKLFVCYSLIIQCILAQPCTQPIQAVNLPITGSCISPNTQTYIYTSTQLGTLNGLKAFTVSLWFRPNTKVSGTSEQALFRMTASSSDTTSSTPDGVRLGLFYTADASQNTNLRVQYAKSTQNAQSFSQPLPYVDQHWVFAAAGLDYTQGIVSYFAWQPFSPSVQVNPQPVTQAANFNLPLNSISQLELLYWGTSYVTFCGSINSVRFYPGYVETGYLHNWLNLAFYTTGITYQVGGYFKMEDGSGQMLRDSTGINLPGCLGATQTASTADPTFTTSEISMTTGQYATLPGVKLGSTNLAYGVSFYFYSSAIISSDADSVDAIKDLVLFKRYYQGTSDIFGIMVYLSGSGYAMKIKLHGVIYSLPTVILSMNSWHFISVRVAYPSAVTELTNIIFDVVLENSVFAAHQVTTLTNVYQESASDTITVGNILNGFSGSLVISNVQLYTTYNAYIQEVYPSGPLPLCNSNCQTSLNTASLSQCLQCVNGMYLNNGVCLAACVAGPTALTDTDANVCQNCAFQCATCQTNGNCNSCNVGFYLQNTNQCVNPCTLPLVGDPTSLLCSYCGNGVHDGTEQCDDKNFIAGDGCTTCLIDTNYVCSVAYPSVCQLRCGDGVIQSINGELCDDGNHILNDGCSLCQIDAGYKCTGTPSVCKLLCGDAIREINEGCDDGNINNGDGCSSKCLVEPGYACAGLTPDVCTFLCGNAVVDFGEQCDDGNVVAGDGCTNCVVDQGWICPANVCQKVCGNGVRDTGEQCDNGIQPSGTGCTHCMVDIDYICRGGSSTSSDICTVIPDICGDGIKKSSENCDDGNTVDGDGCSHSCQTEIGFTCSGGSQYTKDTCYEICGDARRVGIEQCDDGNIFGGDGCNERCNVESQYSCTGGTSTQPDICVNTCGNGIVDPLEECDDNNQDSGDGCSSTCQIESGWGCQLAQDSQRDQCFQCIPGCASCTDKTAISCTVCYYGFMLHVGISSCIAGCPDGYYADHTTYTCSPCQQGCSQCQLNTLTHNLDCIQCQYNYYLLQAICYTNCPSGYYNQPNVIQGNTCQVCTPPCAICTSSSSCQKCGSGFYMDNTGVCQPCGMGPQCQVCDFPNKKCLSCASGYYRNGANCTLMMQVCGDGYHHPLEVCDDGNTRNGDGCSSGCRVESNWDCILNDPQGPDVCFQQSPANITTSISQVQYNMLYVTFSRPLQNGINFNNITLVSIPVLDNPVIVLQEPPNTNGVVIVYDQTKIFRPYKYVITQIDSQTLEIEFNYSVTVQGLNASINITRPDLVVDIYNWTLVGKQSSSRVLQQSNQSYKQINGSLQYYIYYTSTEVVVNTIVAWMVFGMCIIGICSSAYYAYQIGEGRNWKMIEVIQTISMMRYLSWRYGSNLEVLLMKLDYFNGTFIFNLFTLLVDPHLQIQEGVKFQMYGSDGQFLLNGGGRFISWFAYAFAILFINEMLYRGIKWEALEYHTEMIHKLFTYQGLIKMVELLFFDLMISVMVQLSIHQFQSMLQIVQFTLALLMLICSLGLMMLIFKKFVLNKRLTKVEQFYDKFGTLFDSIGFDIEQQKVFTLIPYIQKIMISIVLVFIINPYIQVAAIVLIRLIPHMLAQWQIPFYLVQIYLKEIVYESLLITFLLTTMVYSDFYGSKASKQANGWGLMSILFVMVVSQCSWVKWAYDNIDKMTPPPLPQHEEVEVIEKIYHTQDEEEQIQLRAKTQQAIMGVLEQEGQMQEMENDFFGAGK